MVSKEENFYGFFLQEIIIHFVLICYIRCYLVRGKSYLSKRREREKFQSLSIFINTLHSLKYPVIMEANTPNPPIP